MKINKTLILGMVVVMIGAAIVDFMIIQHVERKKALPSELFGFAVIILGGIIITRGKKQQLRDRENNGG